jgi:hypothetical protein
MVAARMPRSLATEAYIARLGPLGTGHLFPRGDPNLWSSLFGPWAPYKEILQNVTALSWG